MATIGGLMIHVGVDIGDLKKGLADADRMLKGLDKGVSVVGSALKTGLVAATAAGTAAVIGLGTASINTAMDYQSSMNLLQATSKASTSDMAALDEMAIALGADMSLPATSATDASEAMLELSKAGLSVKNVLSASRGVLQLSAAGQLSNADAATITANALNSFNLEGSEATRIADLLAAASNASSAEVRGVADSLQMAGAVFAMAGVPIQDLVTAIALMANKGIEGSDAGTSLKQMLLALEAPTDKAKALMDSLGIVIYDAQGKMIPLASLIGQFSTKLGGLTQAERDAALATIFGSDAVRAANIVMMGGMGTFQSMRATVTEQGAAAELAAARTKGLGGAIEGLKSQIETGLLTAGKPFLQPLEDSVRSFAETSVPQLSTSLGLMAADIAPKLGTIFGDFLTKMQTTLPPAIEIVERSLTRIGKALGLTTGDVTLSDVALGALKGTLDAIVIGVQLVAGSMDGLANVVEKVTKFVNEGVAGWQKFKTAIDAVGALPALNPQATGMGVPGRAAGGPVAGGQPYLVGERGPELFVPGQSGAVVPNGGGNQQILQVNIDGRTLAEIVLGYQAQGNRRSARMGASAAL